MNLLTLPIRAIRHANWWVRFQAKPWENCRRTGVHG